MKFKARVRAWLFPDEERRYRLLVSVLEAGADVEERLDFIEAYLKALDLNFLLPDERPKR